MTTHADLDSYIECALWSSISDDGTPMDDIDAEMAPETLEAMQADLEAFVNDPDLAADLEGLDPGQIAHDFWLTRNGHGAGFWDRGLGARGERLTDAAHAYGSADLYVGDDGLIYQS